MRISLIAGALVVFAGVVFGQSAPAFDVASVKQSPPFKPGMFSGMTQDAGRFTSRSINVRALIVGAFHVETWRVAGAPAWVEEDGYDVEATYPADTPSAQVEIMLQTLLGDRFQLKFHRETREAAVYALVVAKGGPKLEASPAEEKFLGNTGRDRLELRHASMATLSRYLVNRTDRPIVDITGIQGLFNMKLKWTPDTGQVGAGEPGPSIYTAIQEQLGLRLEPRKSPTEYIVIDHIERPSQN